MAWCSTAAAVLYLGEPRIGGVGISQYYTDLAILRTSETPNLAQIYATFLRFMFLTATFGALSILNCVHSMFPCVIPSRHVKLLSFSILSNKLNLVQTFHMTNVQK